jgi:hypothetical protein
MTGVGKLRPFKPLFLLMMLVGMAGAISAPRALALSKADQICNDAFGDLLSGNGNVAALIDKIEKALAATELTPQEIADVKLRYKDLIGAYPEDAKTELSRIIRAIERTPEVVGAKTPQEAQVLVRRALEKNGGACSL